jgi:hypothetical protein
VPSLNPPGQEKDCIAFLAHMLRDADLDVRSYEFAPAYQTLIQYIDELRENGRVSGNDPEPPVCSRRSRQLRGDAGDPYDGRRA